MDIKIIAIDIDGTLLNEKDKLAPATIEAIKGARAKGVKVVLCTGRPLSGLKPYLEPLGIEGHDEYAIAYNGAVAERVTGETLASSKVNYEDFLEVEMMSRELGVNFQVETDTEIEATNADISPYTVYESQLVNLPIHYRTPEQITRDTNIFKCMYIDEPDKIDNALANLPTSLKERMQVVKSTPVFLEFMNVKASKGNALKALTEDLGFNADNVMAIGDQGNDLSMIKYAGLGVAMGNAIPEDKEAAQFITKPNNEDGVAFAINKFVNDVK